MRDTEMVATFMGQILNAVLSIVAKNVLQHRRPTALCEALNVCHSHGMPSSHAMVMAGLWMATLLRRPKPELWVGS
ncbi:hypothetical protein ACKKBG_A34710 [Auxenochlorella protothecoides x Auxenochlorella symbiontica]